MTEPAAFSKPGIQRVQLVDVNGNAIGSAAAPSSTIVQGVNGSGPATVANPFPVALQNGNVHNSYIAWGVGYTAYANPTALVSLQGSATKIVRITTFIIRPQSTSGTLIRMEWWKRAANTGGTKAATTPIKLDSVAPAATAVAETYSVIPSALGAGDKIASLQALTNVVTIAPSTLAISAVIPVAQLTTPFGGVTLRGANEFLQADFAGAALPAGFTCQWELSWTESDV